MSSPGTQPKSASALRAAKWRESRQENEEWRLNEQKRVTKSRRKALAVRDLEKLANKYGMSVLARAWAELPGDLPAEAAPREKKSVKKSISLQPDQSIGLPPEPTPDAPEVIIRLACVNPTPFRPKLS